MKKLLHAMRYTGTLIVLVLTLSVSQTQAQLVVSAPPAGPNYTALVQSFFVGQGVTVSNVSYTGGAQAIGSFTNANTNLSLAGGIILTTGNRTIAIGPNNAAGAGSNLNRPGLPELDAQAGANTFDGAVLQFDFVAQSASVSFQYIWASEEYPEYVNAGYNDAFSFFISGPGFGGPTNIALVPNTTTPITIDNVNANSYSQYYVNNAGGQYIQYDGFTTTMTATAAVQPCQTYTLRICIADAGDHIYDSAVFLGQNSLSSNSVTVSSSSGYNGSSNAAYEGCLPGYLNFTIPQAQLTDYTFNYVIGGTAQNGVDYQAITTSVTIPAGQTSAQVVINAINDNTAEGQETVDITVNNMCTVSTTTVYINDVAPLTVNAGPDQAICTNNGTVTMNAVVSGGLTPYTYSWSSGQTTPSVTVNPPNGSTTYTVTVNGACPGQTVSDQVVVTESQMPNASITAAATLCTGNSGLINSTGTPIQGATYTWNWDGGTVVSGSGGGPFQVMWNTPGTKNVTLTIDNNGCIDSETVQIVVNQTPNVSFTISPACTDQNATLTYTGTVYPGATYNWQMNGGQIVSGSGVGPIYGQWNTPGNKTATLVVTVNGCSSSYSVDVVVGQTPDPAFTLSSTSLCTGANGTVTYSGVAIPGQTYSWNFNGGTVVSGSGAGPYQINWSTAGTKTVTLTVNNAGCSISSSNSLTVYAPPTAALAASSNTICNGQALTASATPVTGGTYAWSANNGATITGTGVGPVTVNYPGPGTYIVSLAVTQNGCTSTTANTTVTVNPQPAATFTAATPLCTGVNGTITYNAVPVPGATYTWNFNGGTVASGSGMGPYQVNWATAGTKTVTLTVAANGCTATSSQAVVVNQMPTSTFSVSAAQFCAGANATVTYGGTVLPGATYTWNFNGGTVVSGSGVGPYQIAWSTAGTKTITLSVTSNGCTSTVSSQSITVYQIPTSTFTASAATVCAGQPLTATYSGNASGSATYTWSANNGATITGNGQGPVSLNYPSAGSYNITLNVAENGCSSTSTTVPVTVNPQPTATFTATSPLCTGNNGTITYTGIQIPGATYTWNFAGGTVVSGSGVGPYTVSWATAGTKTVTLTVAAAGCTASNSVNVIVNQMPSSSFTVSNTQFCAGANATVTYNAVPVPGATYTWNFNGGTVVSGSGLGPYTINWSTAGTKTITLTVSANGCTSTITSVPVTIYQVPTSTFTLSSNSVCDGSPVNITYSGNASPAATYTWTASNNGSISSNPSLHLVYPAPGTYNIGLTVTENGCSSTTTTVPATVKPMPTSPFTVSNTQFCAGANATVTYTGTPITGATYAWNFNGGTVVSGSGAGPYSINWSTPGTKTLTLTVTAAGCTSTVSTQTITIYQVPTSTFTLSSASVCDGSPVNITYGGNASPNATYNWTVNNNGSISSTPSLHLVYPAPGTYNIGLTVTENGCSSTATTVAATVKPMPTSNFSVSAAQFCAGANGTVTYNGTPITGAVYTWNFNGGTVVSGSGAGPYQIAWNTPGTKTLTLTVTAAGCTSTVSTQTITIYQVPTSTFTLSSASVCDGSPVNITYGGNASPNATYNWTVNNGGSIGNNPLHLVYPAPGTYSIGLIVTENGCSSTSTTLPATVKPQPVATFTAPSPVCDGQPEIITYTGTQITGASYTWGFNGAIVASGTNAGPYNVSWATPGTKNVTLTVNAAGCTASSSTAVVVNQMPTSSFSVSNTQFCAGGNATVTFNGVQVNGANYTWNFNGGNIVSGSGMGPYTINWDTAGTKQITLTVSASGCTSTTTTIPVTIYQVPTSSFTTSASSICNGQQLGITYSGNASPNATYTWTVNNGGSIANNPLHLVYPTSGSYNITLNVTENGCSSGANTVPVTVYTVPTANFTVQGPICEGASVNVLYTGNANLNNAQFTWGWDGGTATNTSGENYSVQYASAGNYDLTLHVAENGCGSIDVTQPLVVNAIPTSTFIATSPVCTNEGSIVTYTGSAPQNATYAWTFDGGTVASGSGQGPYNINWNNAGVKSLKLIVTHNGCASPQTIVPVTVNDRPTAAFTIADTSICMGQPVTITYNGTGSPNATYNWTASGGATVSHISGTTYQMGYPSAGNYTITLSVTELGCASATPVTAQVSVYDMPTSAFVSSGSPICDGTPLSLVYQGNASPNANFIWNVSNGATIGNLTPSGYPVNYPGAGTYNISLTVSENGCTSTQSSTSVIVYQTPTSAFVTSANPVCNGNPVDFYYNGNASPNATYNWEVTNGASIIPSGVDTFNLAYTGAGTYIVKLTVLEDGCSSTMSTDTITVFEVPVSVFAAVQNPVCDGQPVILNYNGVQIQNAVYTWTTPDSVYIEESGLTSYEVFYPGAGTYNVSLKVTANGCSSDTTNLPIVVNANPVAPFTASNNVCVGANGNIIYTGVQDPNYTYNWNFDGGNIVSGNNQGPYQISWATDGVKDVTLIVTNGNGCSSDTAVVQVTVFPIPSSSFTVTGPLCTDANGTVYYTGASLQNSIYNWSFDGANIVSGIFNGPYSLNWSTPGTKLITLDVTANGCTSPVTMHTVVVNPTPTASFMALDSAVCEGGPITLVYNGNASPGANYNWFTTGGATVSGTGNGPFTVNYPGPGTYYITLTVDENGCTSPISATLPVTVLPNPNAYFTVPVGECFGNNSYNFLALGQFTFQADIAWNFGPNANVQTSTIINPSNISFNTTGAQTVSLTVTDNGCTSNFSNIVQVYPDPVINFSADEVRGCSPLEVQFTDNSGYGGLATYLWNFGDGDTSSLQNPIHIYEQAGTYSPSLTITFSSACGGSITQSGLITVYPQPVAGFTATPEHTDMFDPFVTVVNDGSGATACYYTMGDGDTLMNTLGGTHEYTNAGVYTITQFVSNSFGCVDTAQRVIRIDGQFTIYIPNAFSPNNDGINDSFGAKGTMVNNFTLYIFDRWGELIFTGHGIDDYWDGSDPSGKRSQVDVYVYKVVYDEPNGDQKQAVGTVALID